MSVILNVIVAQSDADIARCFAVMQELRPHLKDEAAFVARAKHQIATNNWHLAFVEEVGAVAAVAGYRFLDCLATGKTLYVDDLVTALAQRSKGHGETLLTFLKEEARARGCETFSLDSGTHRTAAHKFYFREGLVVTSFHFAQKL